MKKNRKVSTKMSVLTDATINIGVIFVVAFLAVIMNVMASSGCQQLMKTIGESRKQIGRLDEALQRESTRWEEMKTPARLEAELLRHGLSMKPPRADQNVYMKADGKPRPGQLAVRAAQRRLPASAKAGRGR